MKLARMNLDYDKQTNSESDSQIIESNNQSVDLEQGGIIEKVAPPILKVDPDDDQNSLSSFFTRAQTFFSEMVEENPVKFLVSEKEGKQVLSEIFVRSRQYITICMVLEIIRMVYLNSSNYQPYELITWILEVLCLFVMFIIILKSYKQKELVRYLVIIF